MLVGNNRGKLVGEKKSWLLGTYLTSLMKDLFSKKNKTMKQTQSLQQTHPQNLICSSFNNCRWYRSKTLCCKPEVTEAALSSSLLLNTSVKATGLLLGKYSTSCENINSKRYICCFTLWLFSCGNTSLHLLPFKFTVWSTAQHLDSRPGKVLQYAPSHFLSPYCLQPSNYLPGFPNFLLCMTR